jgi:hypothetical protein
LSSTRRRTAAAPAIHSQTPWRCCAASHR